MDSIRVALRCLAIGTVLLGLGQLFAGDQKVALSNPEDSGKTVRVRTAATGKPSSPRTLEDGRISISEPITISEPGHYVITKNITTDSGGLINIATGNVTLDLNGMTLTRVGIRILPGPRGGVAIRNGRLIEGSISTDIFAELDFLELASIEMINGGVFVSIIDRFFYGLHVEGCRLFNGSITAVHDPGSIQVQIVNNTIEFGGIFVREGLNSIISGNRVSNGSIEIHGAKGVEVKDNSVAVGKPHGIVVMTCPPI
jgi:hypothetical protein